MQWFDSNWSPLGAVGPEADYVDFRFSPDEKRLAASLGSPKSSTPDIWLTELTTGRTAQLTFGPSINAAATWLPDGAQLPVSTTLQLGFHDIQLPGATNGVSAAIAASMSTSPQETSRKLH